MDVGSIFLWLGLVVTAFVMAFVAAAEASIAAISRAHVRRLIEEGVSRAQALQILLEDPPRFVSVLMVLKAVSLVSATALALALAGDGSLGGGRVALLVLLVTASMLSLQITARAVTVRYLQNLGFHLGAIVGWLAVLLSPVIGPLHALGRLVLGQAQQARLEQLYLSEGGLRFLFNLGEEPGLIEEDEKEMIAGIFELSETVVREVMVPRIDLVAIRSQASLQEALDLIIKAGHSRIPVYQGTIDNIVGVLYAKDLLPALRQGLEGATVANLMRSPYFVPESKKVDDLLKELQQSRVHMAIVVDEYGGTAGVVTIEDLLEEIVGEIQDEYDSEAPLVVAVGDDEYVFDARIDLDEVGRIVGVNFADTESDTLGGLILEQLGRVPVAGTPIRYQDLLIEVQSVTGHRIRQVRIRRVPPESDPALPEQAGSQQPFSALSS